MKKPKVKVMERHTTLQTAGLGMERALHRVILMMSYLGTYRMVRCQEQNIKHRIEKACAKGDSYPYNYGMPEIAVHFHQDRGCLSMIDLTK